MSMNLKLAEGKIIVTTSLDHDDDLALDIETMYGEENFYLTIEDMKALRSLLNELLEGK